MVNSLDVFEKFFEPEDGYSIALLDVTDPKTNNLWRLDLTYDERCKPSKFWTYLFWSGSTYAKDQVRLKKSEVYGFIRAKHPEFDAQIKIKEAVSKKLQKLIMELE